MNVFVLAMTLGPHPVSTLPGGELLLEELRLLFPEGNITTEMTGDAIRNVFTELGEERQHELLTKSITHIDLETVVEIARRNYCATVVEERRFSKFLLTMAIIGLVFCAALLFYIVDITQPLIKSAAKVEQRRELTKQNRNDKH